MEKNSIMYINGKTYIGAKALILPTSRHNDRKDSTQIYRHSENGRIVKGFMNARSTKDVPHCVNIITDEKISNGNPVIFDFEHVMFGVDVTPTVGIFNQNVFEKNKDHFKHTKKIVISDNECFKLPQPTQGFIDKLIILNSQKLVIVDVMIEVVGGDIEILEPVFDNEFIAVHDSQPYTLKLDAEGHPIIHMLKTNWNTDEMTELLIKAISECNSIDGCLKDADPAEASKWVANMLYQIEK